MKASLLRLQFLSLRSDVKKHSHIKRTVFPEFHCDVIDVIGQAVLISPSGKAKFSNRVLLCDDRLNIHTEAFTLWKELNYAGYVCFLMFFWECK